jgi:hypothetical protein
MKEKQPRPQDIEWNKQKLENHRLNKALFTGWDGGVYKRGIMARVLFKGILYANRNKDI